MACLSFPSAPYCFLPITSSRKESRNWENTHLPDQLGSLFQVVHQIDVAIVIRPIHEWQLDRRTTIINSLACRCHYHGLDGVSRHLVKSEQCSSTGVLPKIQNAVGPHVLPLSLPTQSHPPLFPYNPSMMQKRPCQNSPVTTIEQNTQDTPVRQPTHQFSV